MIKHPSRRVPALAISTILSVALAGCATRARPIDITPRVALQPSKDEVSIEIEPGKTIGDIVPVDISAANGTSEPYLLVPNQVFAIDEQGQRILPVPPAEAIQEAGDANALKAGLTGAAKNAAVGLVAGAVIGAAIGAVAGAIVGAPGEGAALGAALGGGTGAAEAGVLGGVQGEVAAHQDAQTQIASLALPAGELHPNFSINGYVFFPKGSYQSVQMTLLNEERHESQTLTAPWAGEGAPAQPVSVKIADSPDTPTARSPAAIVGPQNPTAVSNVARPPATPIQQPARNPNADLNANFENW